MSYGLLFFGFGIGLLLGDYGKSVVSIGGFVIALMGGIMLFVEKFFRMREAGE